MHFVLSEFAAGLASLSVYFFFVVVSYFFQVIRDYFPLSYSEPANFLDHLMAWAAALSGGITFAILTLYSLLTLVKRLKRQFQE